jgi:hypothetical protein
MGQSARDVLTYDAELNLHGIQPEAPQAYYMGIPKEIY